MGKHGNGQLTKMVNNCIYDINCAAIAEMLPMAVKLGLDPEQIGKVVNSGTAKSSASEFFIPQMLEGKFEYGFTMDDAYKEYKESHADKAKDIISVRKKKLNLLSKI
jgi:3-hydroxyisobutyrate dehydrogenase-like beta-hydroxyacid dehydrogenase